MTSQTQERVTTAGRSAGRVYRADSAALEIPGHLCLVCTDLMIEDKGRNEWQIDIGKVMAPKATFEQWYKISGDVHAARPSWNFILRENPTLNGAPLIATAALLIVAPLLMSVDVIASSGDDMLVVSWVSAIARKTPGATTLL